MQPNNDSGKSAARAFSLALASFSCVNKYAHSAVARAGMAAADAAARALSQPLYASSSTVSAEGDAGIFFTYAAVAAVLGLVSVCMLRRRELAGVVLVPFLTVLVVYDNVAIAVSALAPPSSSLGAADVQRARAGLDAFIVPLFLVAEFELNYEVHKRRSANFCCNLLQFDRGRFRGAGGRGWEGVVAAVLRYALWVFALVILLLSLEANAPAMVEPSVAMPLTTRFVSGGLGISSTAGSPDFSDVMDFLPMLVLLLFSMYSGLSLWRYGTTISTDVRASSVNPWLILPLATLGLLFAWVFTPLTWPVPYAVNALTVFLLGAVIVIVYLVDLNLVTLEAWDEDLNRANEAVLRALERNAKHDAVLAARKRLRAANHKAAAISALGFARGRGAAGGRNTSTTARTGGARAAAASMVGAATAGAGAAVGVTAATAAGDEEAGHRAAAFAPSPLPVPGPTHGRRRSSGGTTGAGSSGDGYSDSDDEGGVHSVAPSTGTPGSGGGGGGGMVSAEVIEAVAAAAADDVTASPRRLAIFRPPPKTEHWLAQEEAWRASAAAVAAAAASAARSRQDAQAGEASDHDLAGSQSSSAQRTAGTSAAAAAAAAAAASSAAPGGGAALQPQALPSAAPVPLLDVRSPAATGIPIWSRAVAPDAAAVGKPPARRSISSALPSFLVGSGAASPAPNVAPPAKPAESLTVRSPTTKRQ